LEGLGFLVFENGMKDSYYDGKRLYDENYT
jgi:hypothetical protein